jgi:hypothetical protein
MDAFFDLKSADDVEKAIIEKFKLIPEAVKGQADSAWTKEVKKAIVEIGSKEGYRTACNGYPSDEGSEWLYDILWYKSKEGEDGNFYMSSVHLIAECEWGSYREIIGDFEKLLVARSKYRIMVFQDNSEDAVKELMEDMIKRIEQFEHPEKEDRYIFAGWAKKKWMFKHYVMKK